MTTMRWMPCAAAPAGSASASAARAASDASLMAAGYPPPIQTRPMDYKLELVAVPVSDVDRAKAFYVDQVGFNLDHDHQVTDELRFVQLTPPGSACSIALTAGAHSMAPGSLE